jgi:thiamine biosynthesis protein ThiI
MTDTFLIRSDEIFLKGGNRGVFEQRLLQMVRQRLSLVGAFTYKRDQGVIYVSSAAPISAEVERAAVDSLRTVFSVATIECATRCEANMAAITATAIAAMRAAGGKVFRVTARRTHKIFPLRSQEIAVAVGGAVLDAVAGSSVNLTVHDTDLTVLITDHGAYVASKRYEGHGGLPPGISGKVVALLSGGIDSPVAAWKMLRRGCTVEMVHFHSHPYVGRESVDKVERIAAVLAKFQPGTKLHLVPLAELQREVVAKTSDAYRVLLYRRAMLRIAEAIAVREGAKALVTGDSVGQVASQTLENIMTVSAAVQMPIFRPLAGDNKREITDLAKVIGTYAISAEPHDDCCSLFQPQHPATTSSIREAEFQEKALDMDVLIADALARTEVIVTKETIPTLSLRGVVPDPAAISIP